MILYDFARPRTARRGAPQTHKVRLRGGVVQGEARISRAGLIAGQQQARNVMLERERSGRVTTYGACRHLPLQQSNDIDDPDDMLDRHFTEATYQASLRCSVCNP